MSVSVVIPMYNERDNVRPQYESLRRVLDGLERRYEIIFVNDGSTDETQRELDALAAEDRQVRVLELRKNFGQTAALAAGFEAAREEVIVTIDGDLQNDPNDIPMMLDRIESGCDLVFGWRKDRRDRWLTRRVPSRIANWLISKVTGFRAHDLGCGLKVIRADVARELKLYGGMHRFLPVLADAQGARCVEVVTGHRSRRFGRSKYGLRRTSRVLCDLLTVKFLTGRFKNPMRLFAPLACLCGLMGTLAGVAAAAASLISGDSILASPWTSVSGLALLFGLQFLGLGFLGEMSAKMYYESEGNSPYSIRSKRNCEDDTQPQIKLYHRQDAA